MLQRVKCWLESGAPHNERMKGGILFLLWLTIQLFAYLRFGTVSSVDTTTYISLAEGILAGQWPAGNDIFYSGYAFVLALIHLVHGEYLSIVLIQIAFSGAACYCMYKLSYHLSKNYLCAFIASVLYIAWIEFHQWAMIVYTDSLFTSFVVILTTMFYFSSKPVHYAGTGLVGLFAIFIRPTGILLLGSFMCYFVYGFLKGKTIHRNYKIAGLVIAMVGYASLLNYALSHSIDSFFDSYRRAEVIYPDIPVWIEKPVSLNVPDEGYPAFLRFLLFITANAVFFTKITLVKALMFVSHIKPYYSFGHNALIGLLLYPIYGFALNGVKFDFDKGFKILMISFLLFQLLTVSFTSENWDGRFLLPVLPFVFIFSSFGFVRVLKVSGSRTPG